MNRTRHSRLVAAQTLLIWASALLPVTASAAQVRLGHRTFTLPDGFTVELVAGPPLADRPIVADFDEHGRLYVADSSGSSEDVQKQLREKPHRIVRLEDSDGDGTFDKQTVFADRMMFPEGAMWLDGSLYVSAPPSIWKLTDTDGDGVADQRAEWFQGKTLTGCANDLHGPYLGPDGWVYWAKGAFAEQRYDRPDGRKPLVTRAAHLFRARPDGTGVESVMTGGMDNPVDVVFTPGGERIFTTTFFQHPGGGQRDGLVHAVYGGVYGKVHDVIDNHPRTGPDVMPVLAHLGPAAPCGLVRYESEAFGRAYRDNLFAALFNMHKVTRHVLTPDGATFKSRDEDFLVCDDLDFHPTDVIEEADGSLLVIDTGGWYKLCCPTSQLQKPDVLGAIYRVRRTDAPRVEDPRGLTLDWDGMSVFELDALLGDPRPAVRARATRALAARGADGAFAVQQVLVDRESQTARLNAVWAATRIDHPRARAAVRHALTGAAETVRQAAAHSAGLWRDREAVQGLLELLKGESAQNRRAAAEALGRIGNPDAIPALLKAIEQPADRALEHSLIYALIEIGDAKSMADAVSAGHPRVRRAAMVALDQMEAAGVEPAVKLTPDAVAAALNSPDAALRETAAWVAGRHPEWGDALAGAFADRLRAADLSAEDRAELQQQLARLAKSPAVQKLLADRLSDPKLSPAERRTALGAMAASGLREIPPGWVQALTGALAGNDPALVPDAVAAVRRLPLIRQGRDAAKPVEGAAEVAAQLRRTAARDDLPAAVRLEALAAVPGGVGEVGADLFAFLTARLDPKQPVAERVAAADVIARAKLSTEQLASLTDSLKTAGPLEIGKLLSVFEQTADEEIGRKLVAALKEAKAFRALRADQVSQRLAKFGPSLRKEAEELSARLNPDAAADRARLEDLLRSLPAGDVRRGQAVFMSQKAACATCHAIGYLGGKLGPDLTRIGQVRQERDLLESIVFPSASFAQSYEPVTVDTTTNERHAGVLRRNDAEEVVLLTGPEQEVRIARQYVKEMRPGTLSVMPTGLDQQLAPQELADLVAFLKACR